MATAIVWNTAGTHSTAVDYEVEINFVSPEDARRAGYGPEGCWHMQFLRGGCHAGAYHPDLPEARSNAERIIHYLRGTHDVFGQPLKARSLDT